MFRPCNPGVTKTDRGKLLTCALTSYQRTGPRTGGVGGVEGVPGMGGAVDTPPPRAPHGGGVRFGAGPPGGDPSSRSGRAHGRLVGHAGTMGYAYFTPVRLTGGAA
eukprot:814017-Prorocentrum_minimum.AAC.3